MREELLYETEHARFVRLVDVPVDGPTGNETRDILSYTVIGDQTKETIDEIFIQLYPVLKAAAPALFLNDMNHLGELSLATKWYAANCLKKNRPFIERSAVFGASKKLVAAAGAILRVAGRNDIQLFDRREDALAWLTAAHASKGKSASE